MTQSLTSQILWLEASTEMIKEMHEVFKIKFLFSLYSSKYFIEVTWLKTQSTSKYTVVNMKLLVSLRILLTNKSEYLNLSEWWLLFHAGSVTPSHQRAA